MEVCKNLYCDWYKEFLTLDYGDEKKNFQNNPFPVCNLNEI